MKRLRKSFYIVLLFSLFAVGNVAAQDSNTLPEVTVKTLKGQSVKTSTFANNGKPIIINFWATCCKPCILELNSIHEEYSTWVEETGVKLIAISIDDARTAPKVAPFVNSQGWEYEVYIDENSDFKRAMNVNNTPCSFLLNGKGEIVWMHNSYSPGDEEELYELVKKLAETGSID